MFDSVNNMDGTPKQNFSAIIELLAKIANAVFKKDNWKRLSSKHLSYMHIKYELF